MCWSLPHLLPRHPTALEANRYPALYFTFPPLFLDWSELSKVPLSLSSGYLVWLEDSSLGPAGSYPALPSWTESGPGESSLAGTEGQGGGGT